MIAIAHQQRELRATMRIDPAAAALYEQLDAAYQQMSESLGGDDPGRAVRAGGRIKPTRSDEAGGAEGGTGGGGLAGGPFDILGCSFDYQEFISEDSVVIGDEQTITRTLAISGVANPVDAAAVVLLIEHEFCSDLDITLTSPSGTTVTLSTDNGVNGSFANVFFANFHNPAGAVPYAFNNGLVTDHNYVSGVSNLALVPEESLSAFRGEDPNGDWTLTITDDAPGDVGTLVAFGVALFSGPEVRTRQTRGFANSTAVPMPVPSALVSSAINVAGMPGVILDTHVHVNLQHAFNADVQMTLTAPDGTIVTLTSDNGGANTNCFAGVTFDDRADRGSVSNIRAADATYVSGVLRLTMTPEESLTTLRTRNPNGTWTLTVADTFPSADGGTLVSWGMTLTSGMCNNACPSDTNGDGLVNVTDLLAIISAWGNCVP